MLYGIIAVTFGIRLGIECMSKMHAYCSPLIYLDCPGVVYWHSYRTVVGAGSCTDVPGDFEALSVQAMMSPLYDWRRPVAGSMWLQEVCYALLQDLPPQQHGHHKH